MKDNLNLLKQFLPNIDFYSAGKLRYVDTDKGRKKQMVIPHVDGKAINKDTNVLKAQLNEKYLVIDSDEADLNELAKLFPSINDTFATRTTGEHKRHFYFNPVVGISGVRKTQLQANGEYDIFTTGIMFESHNIPEQTHSWEIVNDDEVADLTEAEVDLIKHLCKGSNSANYSNPEKTYFTDIKTARIVIETVENDELPKDDKTWKQLLLGINTKEFGKTNQQKRARIDLPTFNHTNFNTMAYKCTYNRLIGHTTRDTFLNILLRDGYNIDVNSQQTNEHLQKSILATLPAHLAQEELSISGEFRDELLMWTIRNEAVVKFINTRGLLQFLVISVTDFKPLSKGENGSIILEQSTVNVIRDYSKDDYKAMPLIKLIDNPFQPVLGFDGDSHMTTINVSPQSVYYENAVAVPTKPDNVLTRLITSYFGDKHQDFYYHWLAHLMYGDRPPQTMPVLVSTPNAKAATGKSSLAQAVPARLVMATVTVDANSLDSGWGDVVKGKKLICINDLKSMNKDKWEALYAFAKDRSSAGARRLDNMKYGGFVTNTDSHAFSFSANWIPPTDKHDRRLWYVCPQNVYGNTEMLNAEDQKALNFILEGSKYNEEHDEFQELANYLMYLYKNHTDKFRIELYQNAPDTEYRQLALKEQRNYSEALVGAMSNSVKELSDFIVEDLCVFVAKFVILQWDGKDSCYLPHNFLSEVLNGMRNTEHKYTIKSLQKSLGLDEGVFVNRGIQHCKFKTVVNLSAFDTVEREALLSYSPRMLKITLREPIIDQYKTFLKEHN